MSESPSGKSRPSHSTVEGRAYLGLRALAKQDGRTSAEYLRLYALEGFLARLASSPHADSLVLKGGVLLAAYDLRRPTADVDLAATVLPNDIERIGQLIASIAQVVLSPPDCDGLRFDVSNLRTETIRDEDEYSGVRVTLAAHLATARETFHVDVNVGDPIWPEPETIVIPARGRVPKWCSSSCRHRAWELTRAAASGRAAIHVVDRVIEVERPVGVAKDAHIKTVPHRTPWPAVLAQLAAQLDNGRVYDRDLPALAQALADVADALDRRRCWRR